ncbi:hypothetical protein L596_010729 [Steinernema carpocapsae]|uniref:Uncharacterized protein n=1 Tax=Steinernema carpocapsae TaxID=34508 RepID=A0A4U5PL28_STECR|nr:hypothetical protein L596_010729 [Steinernema carpocapsae]
MAFSVIWPKVGRVRSRELPALQQNRAEAHDASKLVFTGEARVDGQGAAHREASEDDLVRGDPGGDLLLDERVDELRGRGDAGVVLFAIQREAFQVVPRGHAHAGVERHWSVSPGRGYTADVLDGLVPDFVLEHGGPSVALLAESVEEEHLKLRDHYAVLRSQETELKRLTSKPKINNSGLISFLNAFKILILTVPVCLSSAGTTTGAFPSTALISLASLADDGEFDRTEETADTTRVNLSSSRKNGTSTTSLVADERAEAPSIASDMPDTLTRAIRHPPELQVAAAICKTVDRNMRASPVANRSNHGPATRGIQKPLVRRGLIGRAARRRHLCDFPARERDYLRLNPSAAVLRRRREVQEADVSLELRLAAPPVHLFVLLGRNKVRVFKSRVALCEKPLSGSTKAKVQEAEPSDDVWADFPGNAPETRESRGTLNGEAMVQALGLRVVAHLRNFIQAKHDKVPEEVRFIWKNRLDIIDAIPNLPAVEPKL